MKFSRILEKGMRGNDVTWVQTMLNKHGFELNISGSYDSETEKKILGFKIKNGLKNGSFVDMNCWLKLSKLPNKTEKINIPSIKVSNGAKIYDRISNSNNDNILTEKIKIVVMPTLGSNRPDLQCDVTKKFSYTIGGDGEYDGKIYRCLDDNKLPNKEIIIGICNWGEIFKNNEGYFLNKYGLIIDKNEIIHHQRKIYHKITLKQISSLNSLIEYLVDKYDVEVEYNIYLKL